jgi:type II secretory pathway component PulM
MVTVSFASRVATQFPAAHGRWSALPTRDRRVLAIAVALALAVAVWALVWQPMTRDIAAMRTAIARDTIALAEGRQLSEEIVGLARMPAAPRSEEPRGALERILAGSGVRAAVTQLDWQDGRARLVFAAVGFDRLVAVLEALHRDGRLRIVEAVVTARVEPGSVRAEITLAP